MIFMVFFPLFWALAICGCWFLPLTKFSKVLISVLILAMLCGGIAFLFFDSSSFSFLFPCGFISLPVYLYYFWRRQESYEKYYHIIHTNTLAKNNLKRRAISLFSIGLLGTFMSLWQVEVPQRIVFEIASKSLDKTDGMTEILNENFNPNKFTYGFSKELEDCREKNINCPFFSFKFPIYNIYDKVNGEKIIVAREYGIAYSTSILTRVLTSMGKTKRIRYHISKNENNILY